MKYILSIFLSLLPLFTYAAVIRGEVQSSEKCKSQETMVWLSLNEKDYQKRLLLMHTMVPERGSFEFYVKPGEYLLMGSNEKGCGYEKVVEIKAEDKFVMVEVTEKSK